MLTEWQATSADGASAGWFKIHEMGLVSNNPDYYGNRMCDPSILWTEN